MNINERLRDALGEYRDQARVSPDLFDRIEARTQRPVLLRRPAVSFRTLVPAAAALLVIVTIAVTLVIRTGGPDEAQVSSGAAGGCAGNLYAINDGTVSRIDAATGAVSAPISVDTDPGTSPQAVAIAPDGKHAYVTSILRSATDLEGNVGDGTVSVIATATGKVSAPIPVGKEPGTVAIAPDGKHAYVTSLDGTSGEGTVSAITTATGKVSARIPGADAPGAVVITPDGKHAYVSSAPRAVGPNIPTAGTVSVITTATGKVSARIPVGKGPGDVAITPDGELAYVTTFDGTSGEGAVSVITTATGKVSPLKAVGKHLGGVVITPDGEHAYVASGDYGVGDAEATVSVITTATGEVSAPITVGSVFAPVAVRGGSVLISPDSEHAYLISFDILFDDSGPVGPVATVLVIDTASSAVSARIPLGRTGDFAPVPLAICPARSAPRRP